MFDISTEDDATTVYEKVKELSVKILKNNIGDLEKGIVRRVKQDHSLANYWRKRTYKDGEIDWRMSSKRIYDLVRALTKPYIGAHCLYNGKEIKVWKVRVLDGNNKFENFEPGRVILTDEMRIKIKTGDGLIEIIEHNFNPLPMAGEYL
jgi:methionyl-tRNA formyltransferase